ncbi:hypothetical protein AYO22_06352 [Fonsecaea multimorphosa]|nr:hypothetical protein AYO22_06352 [Fonsecaea multimorphosa]
MRRKSTSDPDMQPVDSSLTQSLRQQCFVLPARRPKRQADNDRTAMLESRMARMETLIQSRQDSASSNAGVHLGPDAASVARTNSPAALSSIGALDGPPEGDKNISTDATYAQRVAIHPWQTQGSDFELVPAPQSPTTLLLSESHSNWSIDQPAVQDSVNVQEQIAIAPHEFNWEHMGPSSWITICSLPGLKWVAERSGTNALAEYAKDLTLSWSQRLKFAGLQHRDKSPEPDAQTAWLYTKAYFEDSLEALYGVVYRPEFEARLQDHLNYRGMNCPTWHALRNVVYATGCRTYLAKQKSCNWSDAQRQSWGYFENALSVYVDLLYAPTGLTAVRALAAMNLHVEGAGNAALESVMCASAVRLAQTKGLHREPPSHWGLSQDEALHRKWLWWAIYIHERQVTHRSGRPSTIDEDNISCQIPTTVVADSTIDLSFMTAMVHHARISAQICRQLLSVSGFRQSPRVIMERMAVLGQQLETWKTSLPDHLKPAAIDPSAFRSVRDMNRTLCVHFAYYGSVTAIHTIFFYPWISYACGIDPRNLAHTQQIVESTKVVAEAARDIIQAIRVISTDATSPQWLVFYFPMVGLINLFIYILKYPNIVSAAVDVSILDIAVGHFGHLEVVTALELSYPFAREVSRIAYNTVRYSRESKSGPARPGTPPPAAAAAGPTSTASNNAMIHEMINYAGEPLLELNNFDVFEMDDLPGEGDMIYFQA